MILFINIFLTDTCIPHKTDYCKNGNRLYLKKYSNFDIFKYCLSSLSKAYTWKKVILKIKLDESFLDRKQELIDHINSEFVNIPIQLFWDRNEYLADWRETYDLFDDDIIWFMCNHDHIFMCNDTNYLKQLVNRLRENSNINFSLGFSHWRECIHQLSDYFIDDAVNLYETHAEIYNRPINTDSIKIITKSMYKNMWFKPHIPNIRFPRPDWNPVLGMFLNEYESSIIPYKEFCRHFDGYYDFSSSNPLKNNEFCPALEIPEGFFENKIQISIGNNQRDDNCVWFNPMISTFFAEDGKGVDYKLLEKDIPLFWKDRISNIKEYTFDMEKCKKLRMDSIIKMLYYHRGTITYNDAIIQLIKDFNKYE